MIRLRDLIERWLRHPALGAVLLLLIAVALAPAGQHSGGKAVYVR